MAEELCYENIVLQAPITDLREHQYQEKTLYQTAVYFQENLRRVSKSLSDKLQASQQELSKAQ